MNRGEVILTFVANVGAPGGKLRPALIVQADLNNARFSETIIAAITSNVTRVHQVHQSPIDWAFANRRIASLPARQGH